MKIENSIMSALKKDAETIAAYNALAQRINDLESIVENQQKEIDRLAELYMIKTGGNLWINSITDETMKFVSNNKDYFSEKEIDLFDIQRKLSATKTLYLSIYGEELNTDYLNTNELKTIINKIKSWITTN